MCQSALLRRRRFSADFSRITPLVAEAMLGYQRTKTHQALRCQHLPDELRKKVILHVGYKLARRFQTCYSRWTEQKLSRGCYTAFELSLLNLPQQRSSNSLLTYKSI